MHEVRFGIVPDTATPYIDGYFSECGGFKPGNPYICGAPLHMQTFFCNPVAVLSQFLIGLWTAISGNEMQGGVRSRFPGYDVKQIEKPCIDFLYIAGSKIPKKMVDGCQLILKIPAVSPITYFKRFSGMGVMELQIAPVIEQGAETFLGKQWKNESGSCNDAGF